MRVTTIFFKIKITFKSGNMFRVIPKNFIMSYLQILVTFLLFLSHSFCLVSLNKTPLSFPLLTQRRHCQFVYCLSRQGPCLCSIYRYGQNTLIKYCNPKMLQNSFVFQQVCKFIERSPSQTPSVTLFLSTPVILFRSFIAISCPWYPYSLSPVQYTLRTHNSCLSDSFLAQFFLILLLSLLTFLLALRSSYVSAIRTKWQQIKSGRVFPHC